MKTSFLKLAAALAAVLCTAMGCRSDLGISSPDGSLRLTASERDGRIGYALTRNGTPVVDFSTLGFELQNDSALRDGLRIDSSARASCDEQWQTVWGEQRLVRNHYNELKISVSEREAPHRRFDVVFRLFDDGMGFRCEFPAQDQLAEAVITEELTEFRFPRDHRAWWMPMREPYYESIARHTPISQMDTVVTPLTMECADGTFLALHEADLTDYAKMNLRPADSTTLRCYLTPWSTGVKVYAATPFRTPWRTLIVGDTPGDLVTSRLMLNLNEPCRIEDTSWIRPAKYIGIWWSMHLFQETWAQGPRHGATTANTKRYIDFAAENGIPGVLVEGWNIGWDGEWTRNTDAIRFTEACPDFDIAAITKYAAEKGVSLIGHHETGANTKNYEAQLEEAFAYYKKYGVNTVKTGYVNELMDGRELHDSQYGVRHYRRVIETAARFGIMIDNHEPVMPTGLERTWPNLMTQEGIRGQEYNAWSPDGGNPPEHTCVVPFLRGLAGPMDYTFGTFNYANPVSPFARPQSTVVREIAQYVVIYSPLQMASDLPENYLGHKTFDFIRDVPTDWEQTLVPEAVIGDYAVFARQDRHSEDWYLGAVTDEEARTVEVALTFLKPGVSYTAQIYADGADADWKTNPYSVNYEERTLTASDTLTVRMASGGGCAVRFVAPSER
ncbi:glycoside hydrolase family 97 protein [Alistipes sp.]|uniref:glycoside hydrolase family 97 protein n=1 Tax=Alistipes sp. TaxID=1872444 RepID=UPI0025C0DF12|nr:glycoside hydrolase family 97 protein [Alistipes sp.]